MELNRGFDHEKAARRGGLAAPTLHPIPALEMYFAGVRELDAAKLLNGLRTEPRQDYLHNYKSLDQDKNADKKPYAARVQGMVS